jgi:cell division protein FtsQ
VTGLLSRATDVMPAGRRPRLFLALGAALLVVVLAVWLVAFSPAFAARSVTIKGTLVRLNVTQLKTAADVPIGTPLVRLDTAVVRARVAAIPEVASASVSVSYPSTVTIKVVERVTVGYLSVAGGYALVDKTGLQFVTTADKPSNLPHFDLAPGADPRPSIAASAQVAAALPTDILGQLDSISAGSSSAVSLVLRDGRIVRWGSPDRNAEKAQLLIPLLKQPGNTFDISDPDSVVVS